MKAERGVWVPTFANTSQAGVASVFDRAGQRWASPQMFTTLAPFWIPWPSVNVRIWPRSDRFGPLLPRWFVVFQLAGLSTLTLAAPGVQDLIEGWDGVQPTC
jgi:hypothetical protein